MLVTAMAVMTQGSKMFENVSALHSLVPLAPLPNQRSPRTRFRFYLPKGTGNEEAERAADP
jgi:hypothetical protein